MSTIPPDAAAPPPQNTHPPKAKSSNNLLILIVIAAGAFFMMKGGEDADKETKAELTASANRWNGEAHSAKFLVDGDPTSAWCSPEHQANGSEIVLRMPANFKATKLSITNGDQKIANDQYGDRFFTNGRPTSLGTNMSMAKPILLDGQKKEAQEFLINDHLGEEITFTINRGFVPGARFNLVCISEIEIHGEYLGDGTPPSPVTALPIPEFATVVHVEYWDVLNVRAEPRVSGQLLDTYSPGQSGIRVLERPENRQGWWLVQGPSGIKGYASASFLRLDGKGITGGMPDNSWVICVSAQRTKTKAVKDAIRLQKQGFDATVIWIPQVASFSGKQRWLTFVGPIENESDAHALLNQVHMAGNYDAYGLSVNTQGVRRKLR